LHSVGLLEGIYDESEEGKIAGAKEGIIRGTDDKIEDGTSLEQRPHVIGQLTLATSSIHSVALTEG